MEGRCRLSLHLFGIDVGVTVRPIGINRQIDPQGDSGASSSSHDQKTYLGQKLRNSAHGVTVQIADLLGQIPPGNQMGGVLRNRILGRSQRPAVGPTFGFPTFVLEFGELLDLHAAELDG